MTEEMVGGQHRSDEATRDRARQGAHGKPQRPQRNALLREEAAVCPEQANTQGKNACYGRPR